MRRLAVGGRDRGHGEWASDGCGRGHSGGRRVWWARDFSGSLEERWEKDGGGVICGRERLSERGPEMKECGTSRGRRGRGGRGPPDSANAGFLSLWYRRRASRRLVRLANFFCSSLKHMLRGIPK